MGVLKANHVPDLRNTEPVVDFPFVESWADPHRIVSIDPCSFKRNAGNLQVIKGIFHTESGMTKLS